MNDGHLQYNLLFISVLLIGTLIAVRCSPFEIVYSGDSCDCPKHLSYAVNIPKSSSRHYTTNVYGYRVDKPQQRYPKPSYVFDFTVEEPYTLKPLVEKIFNGYATIDRITAKHQDCITGTKLKNEPCLDTHYSYQYPKEVAMESEGSETINIINRTITNQHAQAQAQANDDIPYIRRKRGLITKRKFSLTKAKLTPQIFLPNTSGRLLRKPKVTKKFSKAATTVKPHSVTSSKQKARQTLMSFEPLANLRNFLRLPSKRDIKGEYDLIEQERDQQNLHLPEIIQYMPETLNPNFKRGHCPCLKREHNKTRNSLEKNNKFCPNCETVTEEIKRNSNQSKADNVRFENLKNFPSIVTFDSLPRPFVATVRQQNLGHQSPAPNYQNENLYSPYLVEYNDKRKPNWLSKTQLERSYLML
uniref:Uncharacterized protein n=1 Tax=Glossina brevipalpis TaxID=37001 RepID=A0A1A9WC49_9MUSC